jgi:hypothetical protein
MLQHLKIFLSKSASKKRLLLEVAWNLMYVRLYNLIFPFKMLSAMLNSDIKESNGLTDQDRLDAIAITESIENVSKVFPWISSCLIQAATAKRMLNRRNIPSSISFGVKKSGEDIQNLDAHAWLTVCGETLLGGESAGEYTLVSSLS